MKRICVNIPKGTKLYSSLVATRRSGITDIPLYGYVEVDDWDSYEFNKIEVSIPKPCAEGAKQEYDVYFINVVDLSITEENTEQISEFEESNLTEKEVEIYHENVKKHSKLISGNYFDEEDPYKGTEYEGLDAYQRQLKRFEIKRTVRLKPGVTYDYNGQRIGHLPNDYYLEVNDSLVVIRNKSNNQTYKTLRSNLIGY